MKINFSSIKPYLFELIIVTAGVLIALVLNNYKERNQAQKYYNKSIVTINNEIETNYKDLKAIYESQIKLIDTIYKYRESQTTLEDLIIVKSGGLKGVTLSNTGLEFYKKNQLELIDIGRMSKLIEIDGGIYIIDKKMDKLIDYLYSKIIEDSMESKKLFVTYLSNLLDSEEALLKHYENYIDKYIEKEKSGK